jgi:hypothetical protein
MIRSAAAVLSLSLVALAACSPAETEEAPAETAAPAVPAEIKAIAAVAQKYTDVKAAEAAGYMADPSGMCVDAAMEGQPAELGAMGIHYFRGDLLGIASMPKPGQRVAGTGTHTDFNDPAILIYEPQADGSLQLVAVENLVFAAGMKAAGTTETPKFMNNEYVHMIDDPATPADEAHGFEEHYELHAWIPRANPKGTFTPFNPAVTCAHAKMAAPAAAPAKP